MTDPAKLAEFLEEIGLLDAHGAARFLAISERTLFEIEQPRGPLPVVRVGNRMKRYDPRDLLSYIESRKGQS
ncbi:MAG: hypothetical protein AB7K24_16210 [Gemmataceae bacterium]